MSAMWTAASRSRFGAWVVVLFLSLVLSGCSQGMSVSTSFDENVDIETGTPVYLGDVEIGEVTRLTTAGTLTEVELSLDPDLATGLSNGSAALLTTRDGQTVIQLYNYRPGNEPLQEGDSLVGLNNALEYAAWQAGEALDTGKQSMDEMAASVSEYFESEEWQQRKERMNQRLEGLKEDLGRTYEETNRAYRKFLDDLESDSAVARERARESYAELAQKLREEMARLKEQGNDKLVEPLQKLLEDLTRAMEKQPEQEAT